ncbi:MAG: DUF5115 domain-containing protein [Prevotella sp.]|nr:DUF5115 domain-containing protein [Prevotella sp.]
MKKIFFAAFAILSSFALTSCDEDYNEGLMPPMSSPAETPQTVAFGNGAVTTVSTIDLAAVEKDLVKVCNITAPTVSDPEATFVGYTLTIGENVLEITPEGEVSTEEITAIVLDYYGKRPVEREIDGVVRCYYAKDGQNIVTVSDPFKIKLIPEAPQISDNYYIVGGPNSDWAASASARSIKFSHSDADVYEDPIFTVIFDAAEGDTWFAIGDDAACDAIGNGDWSKLLGVVGGQSDATEGRLDFRYNMGADNSFCVPAGTAKKIKVTIDMMEYSFNVETINVADNYYLVGGLLDWGASAASKEQKFSHSSASVAEDPVFTYVLESNGSEIWFAIGDDEACDAIANDNDWSKLYGTTSGNGNNGESGSLSRRTSLSDDGSFKVDGTAKYYRIQINMSELTYTITALDFAQYIYEAGVNNGWGGTQQPLYCGDGSGLYTGFFYAKEDSWTDGLGAFKFRGDPDNWDNGNWGSGTYNDEGGTLVDTDADNLFAQPGFYRADVNLADMTYTLTPIHSVFVVGSAVNNDWDTGVEMTYNFEKLCWEVDTELGEGVIKFKGNGTWDTQDGNWGGTLEDIINGSNDNIPVSVTGKVHIEFYPLCETKAYATVTAR